MSKTQRSMQLCFAPQETPLILKEIIGGSEIHNQLAHLGIVSGVELELIKSPSSGQIMLQVGESQIGICRAMAQRIEVSIKTIA